ncbi:MAG: Uma2 family endonuclease [Cyanobacteria bacterium P01_A01_bin.17]
MTAIAFKLEPLVELTDDAFYQLCGANPEVKFERSAQGELVVMPPTGGFSGNRNSKLTARLEMWADADGTGLAFDSSTMFKLPNGAYRSPDAAWIRLDRWKTLTIQEQESFPPICPDFVVELRSASDSLRPLQDKMQEYLENGIQLGWLLDPKNRMVEIYRSDQEKQIVQAPSQLTGESVLRGFTLSIAGIL